jgi:2,3-bisphosphoglycerate-dependent phosphoglycerate mutase
MQLYIVRHGESHVNVGEWDKLDSMDAGLTEKGNQQAVALHNWLKEIGAEADVLYASTMFRAQETAYYLEEALGLEAVADDRLREIGNNHNDGQAVREADLPRSFATETPDKAPFIQRGLGVDDGESWMHFRIRLGKFIDELLTNHIDKTVYVVAHGGVVSAMFDNIFNVGPYRRGMVDTINTAWTHFEYRPELGHEPWILFSHNRIDHLIGKDLL